MMKHCTALFAVGLVFLHIECLAFQPMLRAQRCKEDFPQLGACRALHAKTGIFSKSKDDIEVVFVENDTDLPEGLLEEVKEGQPPTIQVIADVLGLNLFSGILFAAIAFFVAMNTILGPGWLGLYLAGGSPAVKSASIDDTAGLVVDLSDPKYSRK
mmetsp:Transcript_515/g.1483  ORF Transcript_515/g.1483 Transcript_515/m.1483 type:complete len:156 (+) Transcript_515:131-598(+)